MGKLRVRPLVLTIAVAVAGVGLIGTYRYWESYYQHRGFTTVAFLPHARAGQRVVVNFYSPALHRQADYLVYLPPGYDPAHHRYPVYYLLHGSPGRPQVYYAIANMDVRLDNLLSLHRIRPMIMVFPDGRIGGSTMSDSEWANTPSGNFGSYVADVVHNVDRRFATLPQRADRVIGGFSAGAYGATNVVLHHLSLFGNLQSWSGYYLQSRIGVFAHAGSNALAYNSPLDYVKRLRAQLAADPLRAFLFVGRDDNSSPQQQPMAMALAARGAQVSYALYPGGHDWQLWHGHLNRMLELASREVNQPLRAARGHARTLTPGVVPIPHGADRRHHKGHPRHRTRHRAAVHRHARTPRPVHYQLAADVGPPGPGHPGPRGRGRLPVDELLGGLLLALSSAALINLGFLLQHRGLTAKSRSGLVATLAAAIRNRTWLAGQALGWTGFAAQIISVAIAPLALVQAFAAGGLALSVPIAARAFSYRISRCQLFAVVLMAAGLAVLPIGFSSGPGHLHSGPLMVGVALALTVALVAAGSGAQWLRAVAAGIFYGVADAAIKAVSVGWRMSGSASLWSGWTLLAALATFAGFLAFQAALQRGGAISSISLMNAFAALVALACGLAAFGESLGAGPVAVVAHLIAIAVVLGCVPVLAAAQGRMAEAAERLDGVEARPAPALQM